MENSQKRFFFSVVRYDSRRINHEYLRLKSPGQRHSKLDLPELQRVCCLLPRGVQHLTEPTPRQLIYTANIYIYYIYINS